LCAVVFITVAYRSAQNQTITIPQAIGLPVLAIGTGCFVYTSVQLRRLIRHLAPSVAAAANIEPARRNQARYALLTGLAPIAAIGAGQTIYSLQ
jgi:hypothetical protein